MAAHGSQLMTSRRGFLQQGLAGAATLSLVKGSAETALVAAEPRAPDVRTVSNGAAQLFVDLHDVEKLDNVRQSFHFAEKHPANPVVRGERVFERKSGAPAASIVYDQEEKCFKCWYQGVLDEGKTVSPHVLCYAHSSDGIHWQKPKLALYEIKGFKDNNVVVPPDHHEGKDHWESVLKDSYDPDAARRYKAVGWSSTDWDGPRSGIYTMTSPDGLRWTHSADPVFRYHPRPGTNDLGPVGDAQSFMIDARNRRYVAFLRSKIGRLFSVSSDFVHWTKPEPSQKPLAGEEWHTLYNHMAFPAGDQYLGFLTYFHKTEKDPFYTKLDLRLLTSRNGLHFELAGPNPRDRTPLIACGGVGDWDRNIVMLTGGPPARVGDRFHIYYRGMSRLHKPYKGPDAADIGGIGLATIRADGFASLDAGFDGGQVTTTPFRCKGEILTVNAKADHGEIKAEVLDEKGNVIPGCTKALCKGAQKDQVSQEISWPWTQVLYGRPLATLQDRVLKLRFFLRNARLYSYQINAETLDW